MNFTLHQLQILIEVHRQGSITKAAEEMYMTQPALSIQLKNLQAQFEVPLTEKIGRKTYLTDFGKSIIKIAQNILQEADAIKYKMKEYEGLLVGRLSIASASTGKYIIPFFLSEFINRYPGIDLTLDVSNKTAVLNHLRENDIDFALVSVVPEELNVEEEILVENRLYLVNGQTKLNKDSNVIYREPGSATRSAMDQYFGHQKKRKSISLTSNEAVKQAVIAGLGHSIIPLLGIKNELANKELHIIPAKGLPITTYWRLIWLKNKQLSPIALAYLKYIREFKSSIIEKNFTWYKSLDF